MNVRRTWILLPLPVLLIGITWSLVLAATSSSGEEVIAPVDDKVKTLEKQLAADQTLLNELKEVKPTPPNVTYTSFGARFSQTTMARRSLGTVRRLKAASPTQRSP